MKQKCGGFRGNVAAVKGRALMKQNGADVEGDVAAVKGRVHMDQNCVDVEEDAAEGDDRACIKQRRAGFSLAELLIVVAIIGVLVAISIPIFSSQLEKSREATDLANVRSKYAELMAEVITQTSPETIEEKVPLKQKQEDWQGSDPVTIAGITHYKSEGDTNQWKGVPGPGGSCRIIYDPFMYGVIFEWSGGTGTTVDKKRLEAAGKDISAIHKAAETWVKHYSWVTQLEIDSKCENSTMVPELSKAISNDSLLKEGTWAYLGDPKHEGSEYFFWTSVDTTKVGVKDENNKPVKIPVIVCKQDGSFYVSESTTAARKEGHIAIADHLVNYKGFEKFTNGTKYTSFEDAYAAYEKLVQDQYKQYKDTLPN